MHVVVSRDDLVHVDLLELARVLAVLDLPQKVDGLRDLLLSKLLDEKVTLHILKAASLVLETVFVLQEETSVDQVANATLSNLGTVLLLIEFLLDCLEGTDVLFEVSD